MNHPNDERDECARLPSSAQQALQIVTAWRAVVGGDDLLIHYIKQAVTENRTDAATRMREACVGKVREMAKRLACTCVGERADHHAQCPVTVGAEMITALEVVANTQEGGKDGAAHS